MHPSVKVCFCLPFSAGDSSPRRLCLDGRAATLEKKTKKQAAHRNDCVITTVIQSGPHTHT